jgi:hypothetical protein
MADLLAVAEFRRPGFAFSPAGFLVDKVAVGKAVLQVLQFLPVSIIPSLLQHNGPVRGHTSTETRVSPTATITQVTRLPRAQCNDTHVRSIHIVINTATVTLLDLIAGL